MRLSADSNAHRSSIPHVRISRGGILRGGAVTEGVGRAGDEGWNAGVAVGGEGEGGCLGGLDEVYCGGVALEESGGGG